MPDLRIENTSQRYDYPSGSIFPVEGGVGTPAQGIAAGDSASPDTRSGFDLLFQESPAWGQFKLDNGLRTSLLISLFTDRQADADQELPEDRNAAFPLRRGYWADFLSPLGPDDRAGSRLWTLEGRPLTSATRALARDYALEALAWVDDQGIGSVSVTTSIPGRGVLELAVTITDSKTGPDRRYAFLWDAMKNEGV